MRPRPLALSACALYDLYKMGRCHRHANGYASAKQTTPIEDCGTNLATTRH